MAATSRGERLPGVNTRSVLLIVVVILVIGALFVIPEIVKLQLSLTGSADGEGGASVKPAAAPYKELSGAGRKSTLDQIAGLIDSGYIDELKAKKVIKNMGASAPAGEGPESAPKVSGISWENIRSPASSAALGNVQREALEIARELPADKVSSKYALFNFSSAVRLVLEGAESSMTPEEALRYLEFMRVSVSRTLMREEVDRAQYNRWAALSLGPIFQDNVAVRMTQQKMPFNPRLTLTLVKVLKPGTRDKRFQARGPAYVTMEGYVIGEDVRTAELFLNGNRLGLLYPAKAGANKRRPWVFPQGNARGVYTFRITDRTGQIYEKSYSFYPRVRKFPWREGLFEIPFRGERDNRLDRFFTYRSGRILGVDSPEEFVEGSEYAAF